ncbi:MAG: hypothetical protein R3293_21800, partial [Candidatus Promineifilaceae bacterium]|nr:hypothetical protein [Candidatus Promineifilaceae bacterium]
MKQKQIMGLILCLSILFLAACSSVPGAAEPTAIAESQAQTAGAGSAPAAPEVYAAEPASEPTAEPTTAAIQESEQTAEPTAEPTTEPPAAGIMALTADTDPLEAIARSRLANLGASSMRTTTTITNQDTGEVANTIIGETLLPDRMRVITDFSEMIIVDGVTYNKINGEWSVMDVDMSGLLGEVTEPQAAADPDGSLLEFIDMLGL